MEALVLRYREYTRLIAPSFRKESISENKEINVWVDKYLSIGEVVLDQTVAFAGSTSWFERKR